MSGVTTTFLNTPSDKDRLTILVIEEIKKSVFSLTKDVVFTEQDFVGLTMTFLRTSFSNFSKCGQITSDDKDS